MVSLIMELEIQVELPEEAKTATKSETTIRVGHRTPSPIEESADDAMSSKMNITGLGQQHRPNEGHARYNIFAYGCSPTVHRGIDTAHESAYALLSTRSSCDFLGEHARKDPQTSKAVRRMKSFWAGGEDCYRWVEHDDILNGPESASRG